MATAGDARNPIAPTLLWLAGTAGSVMGLATLFGVPPVQTAVYLGYILVYVLLPGIGCCLLLTPTPRALFTVLLHGWVLGHLLETWSFLLAVRIGHPSAFTWLPLVVAVAAIWRCKACATRLRMSNQEASPGLSGRQAIALLTVSLAVTFPAVLFHFRPPVDEHFTWVAAYANSMHRGWPLEEPLLAGIPLYYHYLSNAHIAAAGQVCGIPALLLASRLAVLAHVLLFVALLFNFARERFNSGCAGALAAIQVLGTYGYGTISWYLFHHATASILVLLPSSLWAFEVLLVAWYEIVDWLARPTMDKRQLTLIAVMLVAAAGVRAQLLPMLIAGVGFLGLLVLVHRRALIPRLALVLAAAFAGLAFGLWFFYGLGTATDGTRIINQRPLTSTVAIARGREFAPIYNWLFDKTSSEAASSAACVLLALVGRLGFLLPGAIAYFVAFRDRCEECARWLLLGTYLAGVGALVCLRSLFQEQWNFMLYGDLAIAILGAVGLVRAVQTRNRTATLIVCLSLPALGLAAYDALPRLSTDIGRIGAQTACPSYGNDADLQGVLAWFQAHAGSGSVVLTDGEVASFDDRVLPVAVPGLQLYANRRQLKIYLDRTSPDPRLVRRAQVFALPWNADKLAALRHTLPPDRALFLLWIGPKPPAAFDGLIPLATVGKYSVFRIDLTSGSVPGAGSP